MAVDAHSCRHTQFFEAEDRRQTLYEMARKGAIDHRVRVSSSLSGALENHGLPGLFLDPESVVISSPAKRTRESPRRDMALYRAHLSDEVFETISISLAEGIGVSTIARIQRVDKKTVLHVLARAAAQTEKVNQALLRDVVVSECQLDEMWSFIFKKEKNLNELEKLAGNFGDAWIWVAFDAVNKVFVATVVGKRTLPHAVSLIQQVGQVTARKPTIFSSDELDQYENALLQVYGEVMYPPRKPGPGRSPNPRLVPPDDLLFVHVVKKYKKNRLESITRRVVFGDPSKVDEVLAKSVVSSKINTSYVERGNLTIRHVDARCNRKTLRFSKLKENHIRQLTLSLGYYHFCRPHRTLTKRHGRPMTPFMAAGLTDHVWTMAELLRWRCPEKQCA